MGIQGSVDHYAAVLEDLEAQRKKIDTAIETIKSLRPLGSQPLPLSVSAVKPVEQIGSSANGHGIVISQNAFSKLSVPEAILKYLEIRNRQWASPADMRAALSAGGQDSATGENFGQVIYGALKRMQERGVVTRNSESLWGLSDWG
jgi:hypothetical protein